MFCTKPEPRSAHEIAYHSFASERQPPPSHWPLLVGEGLHNLRCALDHAVAACVPEQFREKTQYPICTSLGLFNDASTRRLERTQVPIEIRAAIEDTQPYRRLPLRPAWDALELLRSFSDIDKHRTLAAVACAIHFESTYSADDVQIHWEKTGTGHKLDHRETEVSIIVATSERDITGMEMDPHLSYQVRIEGRPLDFFKPLFWRVWEAVYICETGQASAPFSAYPF